MKIDARKDGKGNIIITEDSFEMILNCLDNQKFFDGDIKTQKVIDNYNIQCREVLSRRYNFYTSHDGYTLYKKYENQDEIIEWSMEDVNIVNTLFIDNDWCISRPLRYDNVYLTISEDDLNNRPWEQEEIDRINMAFRKIN